MAKKPKDHRDAVRFALGSGDSNAPLGSSSGVGTISTIEKHLSTYQGRTFKLESKGGQRNVVMSKRSCGHLATDIAKGRGGWNPADAKKFNEIIKTAEYVDSEKNVTISSKKPYHTFHIYSISLRGRQSYIKVGEQEVKSRKGKSFASCEFYAISDTRLTTKNKK